MYTYPILLFYICVYLVNRLAVETERSVYRATEIPVWRERRKLRRKEGAHLVARITDLIGGYRAPLRLYTAKQQSDFQLGPGTVHRGQLFSRGPEWNGINGGYRGAGGSSSRVLPLPCSWLLPSNYSNATIPAPTRSCLRIAAAIYWRFYNTSSTSALPPRWTRVYASIMLLHRTLLPRWEIGRWMLFGFGNHSCITIKIICLFWKNFQDNTLRVKSKNR